MNLISNYMQIQLYIFLSCTCNGSGSSFFDKPAVKATLVLVLLNLCIQIILSMADSFLIQDVLRHVFAFLLFWPACCSSYSCRSQNFSTHLPAIEF